MCYVLLNGANAVFLYLSTRQSFVTDKRQFVIRSINQKLNHLQFFNHPFLTTTASKIVVLYKVKVLHAMCI